MSDRVYALLFQMVPLKNPDTDYGFLVYDEDAEISDFGLSLEAARSRLQPDTLLPLLYERNYGLAERAARKGAYINDSFYEPKQLGGREELGLPDPDTDDDDD